MTHTNNQYFNQGASKLIWETLYFLIEGKLEGGDREGGETKAHVLVALARLVSYVTWHNSLKTMRTNLFKLGSVYTTQCLHNIIKANLVINEMGQ